MMKNFVVLFLLIVVSSCQKNNTGDEFSQNKYIPLKYDTTAIDSFSDGAVSVNVAERIRRSSVAYQDSIKAVKIKLEEERKAREEEKKAAEEKAKSEAEKVKKEQQNQSSETTQSH